MNQDDLTAIAEAFEEDERYEAIKLEANKIFREYEPGSAAYSFALRVVETLGRYCVPPPSFQPIVIDDLDGVGEHGQLGACDGVAVSNVACPLCRWLKTCPLKWFVYATEFRDYLIYQGSNEMAADFPPGTEYVAIGHVASRSIADTIAAWHNNALASIIKEGRESPHHHS